MKKTIFVAFITAIMLSNCSNDKNENLVPLTENETNNLKFAREEEKLARDVYMYAYTKYQTTIFNDISQSEQKHMDAVLKMLNKYGVTDSASAQIGVFNNQELQSLYNNLTTQVNISLIDALKVGATIEDLDINDIDDFIVNTSKQDLLKVYGNLTCDSKNHIRSFTGQLSANNSSYTPQFISLEEYNSILSETSGSCGNN
jgi:hypothetical protein